jgi:signal transduction histidine kinase
MAVRGLVIGLAAAWAARWLSAPIRRLGEAAGALRASLARPGAGAWTAAPPQVDASRGSVEVRDTAQVFNAMARQIQADFDAQRLLLATVSHDLRTPLARLRLRLDAMSADGADTVRAVADLRQMDELLEGLLDLFRTAADDDGRGASTDPVSLVQALVDDLPPGSPAVEITGSTATVACQPLALRRIVQNLLGNALRHSDQVAIEVVPVTGPGTPLVRVRIDDRGPGLSREQLATAGTPFVHWTPSAADAPASADADAAACRPARAGLGLGLHIARALAERAGGRLELGPRPGGGLRADLLLPAASSLR